jgi:Leucine-rich repeat (LRR) protein
MNDSTMEIALQRTQACINGILDLSNLGLSELPPLPDGLTVLRCEMNQLTYLPPLPPTLKVFHCHQNQLTSLPTLPSLESLSCSHNPIDFLPPLPSSLIALTCMRNRLTTLPTLPFGLQRLYFDYNYITRLPELPPRLNSLSCSYNQLTTLPSLPRKLQSLFLFSNPLETIPKLPSTLQHLVCVLPHNNERYAPLRLTSDMIRELNRENQEWAESLSMDRSIKRCSTYYEELMHHRWHPDRIDQVYATGYTIGDM